jgi:hypothetical protein
MIRATPVLSPRAFARSLARKAARLAEARTETRALSAREDPRRWRMARLLWPLMTKD